jgi:hypothetical protein
VPVTIFADNDRVGDRTFIVELVEAVGLGVGVPRRAVVTIRDDDALVQLTASSVTVTEGGTATLMVQRIGSTSITSTVRYATSDDSAVAPADYTAKSGVLTFGPGVSSLPISIVTTNDLLVEPAKTFRVTLSQPTNAVLGAGIQATVTIQDNDTPSTVQFGAAAYSVVEGGTATITVTRSGGSLGPATVNFSTSPMGSTATGGAAPGPGIDYITKSTTLTFAAGATSQTVTVQTVPDTLLEGAETVFLVLTVPPGSAQVTLGAQSTAVLTIIDDEQPRFSFAAPTATVSESASAVALKVMRVGPTTGTYTVNYALAGVTATAGTDFNATGGTLTFGPGVTSLNITVPIVNDTINEPAETFTVTLSGPSAGAGLGTPTVATVTITDDDPAGAVQFAASSYSVVEGGTLMLTVTRTGTAGPVTVAYSAVAGTAGISDFMGVSGVLTFAAGEVTRTFNAGIILGDGLTEGAEFFDVVLGGTTGGPHPRDELADASLDRRRRTVAAVQHGELLRDRGRHGHHHGDPGRRAGGDRQRHRRARRHRRRGHGLCDSGLARRDLPSRHREPDPDHQDAARHAAGRRPIAHVRPVRPQRRRRRHAGHRATQHHRRRAAGSRGDGRDRTDPGRHGAADDRDRDRAQPGGGGRHPRASWACSSRRRAPRPARELASRWWMSRPCPASPRRSSPGP